MWEEALAPECVAVGVSTAAFPRHRQLPGWDNHSYGYHGDDGAIFHGNGHQLSSYGPSFGCGDTVGCGVDYEDASMFFTLNGVGLHTAFTEIDVCSELYPTVGIDANVCVDFNFGERPFHFDLREYIETNNNILRPEEWSKC